MAKLDSKKIESALTSIQNAAKGALRSLNEMTDGEFKGSTLESDPLGSVGLIVRTLQRAKQLAAEQAPYEGKSVEEISEMQEADRAAELTSIEEKFNQKLAKRHEETEAAKAAALAAEAEDEPTGDENPDDHQEPTGDEEPQK